MQKKNMKIKDNITIADQIAAIKTIVKYYFTDGEYTPYFADMGMYEAIVDNFIIGCKLREDEYAYLMVEKDEELKDLVFKFFFNGDDTEDAEKHNLDNQEYISILNYVMNNVKDIVDMKKKEVVSCTNEKREFYSSITTIIDDLDKSLNNISNLDLSSITPEMKELSLKFWDKLKDGELNAENLSQAIKDAVDFKVPETEIYEGQRKQIGNLNNMLREKENENRELKKKIVEFEARNVKADK